MGFSSLLLAFSAHAQNYVPGEIIVKLEGKDIFDLEEKLRLLAKSSRSGDTAAEAESAEARCGKPRCGDLDESATTELPERVSRHCGALLTQPTICCERRSLLKLARKVQPVKADGCVVSIGISRKTSGRLRR